MSVDSKLAPHPIRSIPIYRRARRLRLWISISLGGFDGDTSLMLTKFLDRSLPEASDQKVYRTIEEAMKEPPGPPINDSFAILRLGPVPPGPVEAVGVWLAFAADTFLHSQPQHSMRRLFDPHAALRMGPTNVASYRRHSARSDTAALTRACTSALATRG